MSTPSIVDAIKQQLSPDMIQQMSQQLGTNTSATSKAISMALPVLLGAMSRNAGTTQGASALDAALGAHDGSILGNLGGLLGNAGGGIGGAILGHILGSRRPPVEEGVGRATGIDPQQVGQLLMMLAPIVMGVLGRMKKQHGLDAQQLPQVLEQGTSDIAKASPAAGGLAGVLDSNHDGSIADDLANAGTQILGSLFGHSA